MATVDTHVQDILAAKYPDVVESIVTAVKTRHGRLVGPLLEFPPHTGEELAQIHQAAEQRIAELYPADRYPQYAPGRHAFSFCGSNRTLVAAYCGDVLHHVPHPPHVVGMFNSHRWGSVEKFCLGREGIIPGQGRLHIVVVEYEGGSPSWPSSASGYWYIEKEA